MKIQNIQNSPIFCSRERNCASQKNNSFEMLTGVLNNSAQGIEEFEDLVITAKNAIDSPEDAAIRTLNNKLEKVANNDNTPKPLKDTAKYSCATLITILTFIATKKVIKAPGKFANMAKEYLEKTNSGKNVLRYCSNVKKQGKKIIDNIKESRLGEFKEYLGKQYHSAIDYVTHEFPNAAEKFLDFKKTLKIDRWSRNDYIKNGFSGFVALSSGIGYVKRKSANAIAKELELKNATDVITDDAEISRAAA